MPGSGKVVLFGDPVTHSISPAIHNAAFAAAGLDVTYLLRHVTPRNLPDAISKLTDGSYLGANITLPHKVTAMQWIDHVSDESASVGAINTIACTPAEGGVRLSGYNTDVAGFLEPLADREFPGDEAVIFGTGGSARAVSFALSRHPQISRISIVSRTPESADSLAKVCSKFGKLFNAATYRCAREFVRSAGIIVNATPLGMSPAPEHSPWTWPDHPREGAIAYDLVYTPAKTKFLRLAESKGATAIGGLDMLIGQAAESFFHWTGIEMDRDIARRSAQAALEEKSEKSQ